MVKFDCYKTEYKSPMGALRSGEKARFRIEVSPALDICKVNLVIRKNSDSTAFELLRIAIFLRVTQLLRARAFITIASSL